MELAMPRSPHPAPRARSCPPATLRRWLPLLAWMPHYSTQWLRMDLIAGLSVALTVIPQALAYAEVAGLPPQVRCLPRCPHIPPHRLTPLWVSAEMPAWCCPQTGKP